MISVILPTYLGRYKQAADGREWKLSRAIESVVAQTFARWELIVVADGCAESMDIVRKHRDRRIKALLIDKQPMFSGTPRNVGIEHAGGDWIAYLDNDDFFGRDHLELISREMNGEMDWLFFNDFVLRGEHFTERTCYLKPFKCGTSNIAHRRAMKSRWERNNRYGYDDWHFISLLKSESARWKKVDGQYLVCHIPYRKGFDI